MNRFHEIRIAREGLKGDRFIPPEDAQIILVRFEIRAQQPGHVVFQVTPDPRERIQLGALWGQEAQADVLRAGELGGGVRPAVVQQEHVEAVRKAWAKASTPALQAVPWPVRTLTLASATLTCGAPQHWRVRPPFDGVRVMAPSGLEMLGWYSRTRLRGRHSQWPHGQRLAYPPR
jgi:hypothetical protein